MEESNEPKQFLESLSRWREGCIFYFKFDLALMASVAAIVSFFKLDSDDLISAAYNYKAIFHYLIALLAYALLFEICITNMSNRKDLSIVLSNDSKRTWRYRWFKWGYELQFFAHIALLAFVDGFSSGYVESAMK